MAEAFGIAAGVVGVVSLGAQLGDGVVKLRNLRSTYKEADSSIDALIAELENFERLVSSVEVPASTDQNFNVDEALLEDCKRICLEVYNEVNSVLRELKSYIEGKPHRGAAKFVLFKDAIAEWMTRIGRAKGSLMLAHDICVRKSTASRLEYLKTKIEASNADLAEIKSQLSQIASQNAGLVSGISTFNVQSQKYLQDQSTAISALMLQNNESLANDIAALIERRLASFERFLASNTTASTAVTSELLRLDADVRNLGRFIRSEPDQVVALAVRSPGKLSSATAYTKHQYTEIFRVWLPLWFVRRQWSVSVDRAFRGWQFRLRMHATRPDNSPIFDACATGNIELIRELLSSGEACIDDQTERGLSLLHVAAFSHQDDVCHLLIAQGILPSALSSFEDSPAHHMLYLAPYNKVSVRGSISLFQFLHRRIDTDISADSENSRLLLSYPNWTKQDHLLFLIKLYQPPSIYHTGAATLENWSSTASSFRLDLMQWPGDHDSFRLIVDGPGDLSSALHLAAQRFAQSALTEIEPSLNAWRKVCIDAIRAGADLHAMLPSEKRRMKYKTPLAVALYWLTSTLWYHKVTEPLFERVLNRWLDMWVGMLIEAKVDCRRYEVAENEVLIPVTLATRRITKETSKDYYVSAWMAWLLYLSSLSFCPPAILKFAYRHPREELDWNLMLKLPHFGLSQAECSVHSDADTGESEPILSGLPGSWTESHDVEDTESCSPDDSLQVHVGLDEELNIFHNAHSHRRSWLCIHSILDRTPEAQAYKELRLVTAELSQGEDPIDVGHGKACDCTTCDGERKQILVKSLEYASELRSRLAFWDAKEAHSRNGGRQAGKRSRAVRSPWNRCGHRGMPLPRDSGYESLPMRQSYGHLSYN